MQIRPFFTPGLAIISYIIFDETTRQGAIIDPTRLLDNYIRCITQESIKITHILETHVHADFASGSQELKEILPNKPQIVCSGMGGKEWSPTYADKLIQDKEEIKLGSTRLQAWHTPGHTPEHIIWIAFDDQRNKDTPVVAFTGDLLFVGSVGRPDLLGNDIEKILAKQLYHTLFDTLSSLPDHLEILPAHGAGSLCGKEISSRNSSTLGYERRCNPWLIKQPYEKWSTALLKNMPPAPPYFKRMKQINVAGFPSHPQTSIPPTLDLTKTLELMASSFIIDARPPDIFSIGHLKGSVNIPLAPPFPTWAGSVVPENKDILIVVGDVPEVMFIIHSLKLIGIDNIKGVCNTREWNQGSWKDILHPSPRGSVNDIAAKQDQYFIIDVRTQGEWQSGHITDAHHIEVAEVPDSLDKIPKDKPIAVFCQSGVRASVIASWLNHKGYSNAVSAKGGMQAWLQANLPITSNV